MSQITTDVFMALEDRGSRLTSARQRQSYNPITGKEMPFTGWQQDSPRPPSHPYGRPDGVPTLELGRLDAADGDDSPLKHLDPYHYKLGTPDTASTVSWGTASSTGKLQDRHEKQGQQQQQNRYQNEHVHVGVVGGVPPAYNSARYVQQRAATNQEQQQGTSAWDKEAVPEKLYAPSNRYQQQDLHYHQEIKPAYKNNIARKNVSEADISREMEQLKLRLDVSLFDKEDEQEEEEGYLKLTKTFNQKPYSKATQQKKDDLEGLEREKKKKKLIETVMIDELSRYPICDVEQNAVLSQRVPACTPGQQRGALRKLHDTKVWTAASATEDLLSRRVRFGARILTRVSRDAVRELNGFFFAVDNSLTIYEFRQFGKGAKALPFIKRDVYTHLSGWRKGEPYTLQDIIQGGNLILGTYRQPIPEQLQSLPTVTFRVTDVDDEAKAEIMMASVLLGERDEAWKRLHLPPTKAEMQDNMLLKKVQDLVHKQIERRGIKVVTGLAKLFRQLSEENGGDGKLNKYELEKALIDFHIHMPDELFDDLWEVVDRNCTSFLEYDDFIRAFIGDMTESRKAIVRKAFMKLDPGKKGWVMIDDMRKFYNAQKHPKVKEGECSEEEMLAMFLSGFEFRTQHESVTYAEWEQHYEGLSCCVRNDADFHNMLANAWSI